MARTVKKKTAAAEALTRLESTRQTVKGMIGGWLSRPIPQAVWHDAHDLLATIYPIAPAEWERLEIALCEHYERWRAHTAKE